ncbi:MAG: D-threonine aldolase [Phycisphaerales bacterium]|nr:D-threonine aldolase [Phycisphaerales bacterium]
MLNDLPTPCIVIDAAVVARNLRRMATYAKSHGLAVRPHTKTHKSTLLGRMQLEHGAIGLTVAKVGEAEVMASITDDILMAYPAVDPQRCARLAQLARSKTVRVGIDSTIAADALAAAARSAGATVGILVDLDVGHHRTGVQSAGEALALAQHIDRSKGLRLDGVMFFPGHIASPPASQAPALTAVGAKLEEVLSLWRRSGLEARVVSGGSTPTAYQSHLVGHLTEIRPGTYVYNDMNCVRGQCAALEDCAARILATVVSTAVPGQVVLDAGSKTLTSDRCGPAPDSGHGHVLEYPQAKITKLSEEHAQVDVTACDRAPKVGERVTVIPNHICPCVNLQDQVWWKEEGSPPRAIMVEARGKVF